MSESIQAPDERQLLDALQLNLIPGIGPRLQQVLQNRFGSPGRVLRASPEELQRVPGVGPRLARALGAPPEAEARRQLDRCRRSGIEILLRGSAAYPGWLERIDDPPGLLYRRGTVQARDEMAVAIVGSRHCSLYGRQQAERLGAALARAGMTVVSGLARGIDAAAHRGALSAGGRTLAVFATGLAQVYPPEHHDLAEEIVQNGAVLSESPLDQPPVAGLFPQRNRIISGLAQGVIIVEASSKSGALHTARHAMEQGREVFAVPGRIDRPTSRGCHDLIRDGAVLIRGADDVLEDLGPLADPVRTAEAPDQTVHVPRELKLNEREREVLTAITSEPRHVDEILRSTDLESSRVLSTLTVLEMKRLIRRFPGGYVARAH